MKQTHSSSKTVFELSLFQLCSLSLGLSVFVVLGYLVGFQSGRSRGMNLALEATEEYLVKLPVEVNKPDEKKMASVASRVYASLSLEDYEQKAEDQANGDQANEDVRPLMPTNDDKKAPEESDQQSRRMLGDRLRLNRSSQVEQSADAVLLPAKGGNTAAPKSKPVESEATTSVAGPLVADQGKVSQGWYVQVSAPGVESDAFELADKLHESGFPVVIEKAKVQQRTYFRVLVGPEEVRLTAERLLQQLLRERYIDKAPFIRRVR
jgi:cell division septation protein DedD